ncbi:MAG TPA: helicase-related protein [Candidatus Rubrimentiphilum sp.]|nr:helicase-related protein [Candidatus Rubrimentiphilum sp.]
MPRGRSIPHDDKADDHESIDEFVERMFAQQKKFLERDAFAGIGERDTFPTKIVGVSFEGRQDVAAGLVPGLELHLERQPQNPVDSNAIAVKYGALQIGFLRKQIAKHLAPLMDAGMAYGVRVEHVTGGRDGKNYGVNIRVSREVRSAVDAFAVQARAQADHAAIRRALIGDAELHKAQRDVLARLDAGKNTLAVMGTGRGKSFCFQYPAAYRALESGQKTLVLYPLRALANDQFEALKRRLDDFGLRILRANGAIGVEERATLMAALEHGEWDVILATPEFLQFHREAFAGKSAPSLLVVDEAHHAYESNHRAAYGKLSQTIAALGGPQILGLTATARDEAFAHVVKELKIDAWVIDPSVRENLRVIDARGTRDKLAYLRRTFAEDGKAIVYCNSRNEVSKVADGLRKEYGNEVMFYHAGMPSAERAEVENYFRSGQLRIVVATSAFGEGIDLPDVRHVVLYHLNFSFTEFNQQAGRAGRDGAAAQIHLLFGESDRRINEYIIDQEAPTLGVLRELYRGIRTLAFGGVVRLSQSDIASTLEFDKVNERTVGVALRIFEDEGLIEAGIDDGGRYVRFLPAAGKIDLTRNERFAEGEAERDNFARFCGFVLSSKAETLERIINRPIYPQGQPLLR